jgi:hypothetical protein
VKTTAAVTSVAENLRVQACCTALLQTRLGGPGCELHRQQTEVLVLVLVLVLVPVLILGLVKKAVLVVKQRSSLVSRAIKSRLPRGAPGETPL